MTRLISSAKADSVNFRLKATRFGLPVFLFCLAAFSSPVVARVGDDKDQNPRPVAMSEAEMNDFNALNKALSAPETFFPLAEAFLQKYPESRLRGIVHRDVVISYGKLNQLDKAFEAGARGLQEKAENISIMLHLAELGASAVLTGDKTVLDAALAHAGKALSLIEAGKQPYEFTDLQWTPVRAARLARLCMNLGVLQSAAGDADGAVNTLTKSLQFDPRNPYTQYLLGKTMFTQLKTATQALAGEKAPAKKSELTVKVQSLKEQMLLSYTRALVLSEDAKYSWLRPSVEAEVKYVYQVVPEAAASQTLNAQVLLDRVKTEQNAEPIK